MINLCKYEDSNKSGIYKIVNKLNGKFYIGSASCFRTRYNAHSSRLSRNIHHSIYLMNAYIKDGCDNFEFIILELCDKNSLYIKEQYYIDLLKPIYNMQLKAGVWRGNGKRVKGGFIKGYKPSLETLQKKKEKVKLRRESGIPFKKRGNHLPESIQKMKDNNSRSNAKLLITDVQNIKKLILEGKLGNKDIAPIYNVTVGAISSIRSGRVWKNILI